ncbi:MAG: hypothetical protein RLZZ387_1053 [Chloroflexota bacterium]
MQQVSAMSDTQFLLPSREESLDAARRQLATRLRPDELVWVIDERYDEPLTMWYIDVLRLGAQGRWMRQRHRYDAQAATLYFLGESALPDAELKGARRSGTPFDVATWKK